MSLFFFLKGALIGYLFAVVTILNLEIGDLTTVIGIAAGCLALYSAFAFLHDSKPIRKRARKAEGSPAATPASTAPAKPSVIANSAPAIDVLRPTHNTPQSAIVAARNRIRCRNTQSRLIGTA